MSIVDNILKILEEKQLTKKEFANRLIALEPKVGINGETPSERTIYLYLQKKREIKADLIPYIADVLDVAEQELFIDSERSRLKYLKYIFKNPSKKELEFISSNLIKTTNVFFDYIENLVPYAEDNNNKKIELYLKELIKLIPYIPVQMLQSFIKKAKQIKDIASSIKS